MASKNGLTGKELAQLCGVSPPAITQARNKGLLNRGQGGLYDPNDQTNALYIQRNQTDIPRRGPDPSSPKRMDQKPKTPAKTNRKKPAVKNPDQKTIEHRAKEPKTEEKPNKARTKNQKQQAKTAESSTNSPDSKQKEHPKAIAKRPPKPIKRPAKQLDLPDPGDSPPNYHLLKVQHEARLKEIAVQKELGRLVPREKISPVWNRIYKSLSYFSEFGQRYAGEWAAALGVSDPERIQDLEVLIDSATERFAADFAASVEGEI